MFRVSREIDWRSARQNIRNTLSIGMDLNNSITPSAVVTDISPDGFDVSLGGMRNVKLKWSVVESCWKELCEAGIYDKEKCCNPFGRAFLDPDCLDFVIQRLFKRSGLLKKDPDDQMKLSL